MATLTQMVKKYGEHDTARIFQLEGHHTTQPRIHEALHPRKGRSATTPAAVRNRNNMEAWARHTDLRHYPKGSLEGENVASSRKYHPAIRQRAMHRHITEADIKKHRVTQVKTGHAPTKFYDGRVSWDEGAPELIDEWSTQHVVNVAIERYGPNAAVTVTLYGTFQADLGKYKMSDRFTGFREDYYKVRTTMGALHRALRAEQEATARELRELPASMTKTRELIKEGSREDPVEFPGFAARWANRWHEVRWVEVNHINIVHVR